jgi:CheY-like chemotaxis protein
MTGYNLTLSNEGQWEGRGQRLWSRPRAFQRISTPGAGPYPQRQQSVKVARFLHSLAVVTLTSSASEDEDSLVSQHLRVLVADDEPLLRALIAIAFETEGYEVDTAANGVEALEKACQRPPQVIVLDLMMPVMNGWDFLAAWRGQPAGQTVPVVVTTAAYRQDQLPPLDVEAFLPKPFDLDRLVATVAGLAPSTS